MKTELLFQSDSYLAKFEAAVLDVRLDGGLILDKTAFYYASGGQPGDMGEIKRKSDGLKAVVREVKKADGEVVHYLQPSNAVFSIGDVVLGEIDWPRRHRLMRMHTAGHALSAIFFRHSVLITGNQLDVSQSRFDFNTEQFDRGLMDNIVAEANKELAKNLDVKVYSLPREEAMKLPGFVKLATALPPALTTLRIVEIAGLDVQADGGTHVRNTSEAGQIQLLKMENKGAKNRRIYFTLHP